MSQTFRDSTALTDAATAWLAAHIQTAINDHGQANIFLSGGSSPKPIYEALSDVDLPWDRVTISLVDERWVDERSPGSNTAFLRSVMFQNKARHASLLPLYNNDATAEQGAQSLEAIMPKRIDICVMGMGLDAHTASWFPNSKGLDAALDVQNPSKLCAIDAAGCPVAGDYPERISLTRSAVLSAGHILLLLPSAEKTNVFKTSKTKSPADAPVAGLLAAGPKLTVFGIDER